MRTHSIFRLAGVSLLTAPLSAQAIVLRPHATFDVSAAALGAFGDVSIEKLHERLWVADGAPGGRIHEFSMGSGNLLSTLDPAAIPGLDQGPEALAITNGIVNPPMDVFSPLGESVGGRISHFGNFVADYGDGHAALGADFDASGDLWLATGVIPGGGVLLKRLNPATGNVLHSIGLVGVTARAVDIAFDPVTDACHVLLENGELAQVNIQNGIVVESVSLVDLLPPVTRGGFDFDRTGEFLWFAIGNTPATSTSVTILRRDFDLLNCSGLSPGNCPCGVPSAPGHGCPNSVHASGALLDSSGVPNRAIDTLRWTATALPPNTTALLFQGTTFPAGGATTFGDGRLCVSGSVIRLGTVVATNGSATWPRPGDPPLSVSGQIPSSGIPVRYYQVWYRNAHPTFCTPATFNLTNSQRLTWL
ncbi:MAG: hypothetical protein JNK02_11235 [Planctomycetes bacterium]|nr:hypothetical protein [Planctomycetota bacterium]